MEVSKKIRKQESIFYIVDIGIDPLTAKRRQKKKRGFITKKRSRKCFNKAAFGSSYWNICRT